MELGKEVGAPKKILEACDSLNPHYIAARYPIDAEYDETISAIAIAKAEEVVIWSEKKLKT